MPLTFQPNETVRAHSESGTGRGMHTCAGAVSEGERCVCGAGVGMGWVREVRLLSKPPLGRSSRPANERSPRDPLPAHALQKQQPVPRPECAFYINHHYKFIFVRNKKAGSTTVVKALGGQ